MKKLAAPLNLKYKFYCLLLLSYLFASITFAKTSIVKKMLESEVNAQILSGAVVLAGNASGKVYFSEAVGKTSFSKSRGERIFSDAIFDIASLTKPLTAIAVMNLIEQQKLKLTDTLKSIFGLKVPRSKKNITVEMLLRHRSGLYPIAQNLQKKHLLSIQSTVEHILSYPLSKNVGQEFLYSDLNFMLLAQIVAKKSGRNFYEYLNADIFPALDMDHSFTHQVPSKFNSSRVVSQLRADRLVNDPRAMLMSKGAGHAGVFSTVRDFSKVVQHLLGNSEGPLNKRSTAQMTRTGLLSLRGLGLDVRSPYNKAIKGSCFGPNAFGHTGYTGTSFIAEPATGDYLIIFTNRRISKQKSAGTRLRNLRTNLANLVCKYNSN